MENRESQNSIDNVTDVTNQFFKETIDKLAERCNQANIECVKEKTFTGRDCWEIKMPSGREKKSVYIIDIKDANNLLSINFEDYILINEFAAICSYKLGTIESFIQTRLPLSLTKNRLFGKSIQTEEEVCITIDQPAEIGNIKIHIGQPSNEIIYLCPGRFSFNGLTIKIEEIEINKYDKAVKVLEKISNAIFFQIDLCKNLSFTLLRDNRRRGIGYLPTEIKTEHYKFPNTLYDDESISLYFYARNSNGIPLLQYLAFYQSIEFYFPVYSEIEAKKTIKNILKNPTFNPNNDLDLTKVLSSVKSNIGKGYDNERNQLKATLKECINIDDFKMFLNNNELMANFLTSNSCKKLSKYKLNLKSTDDELLNIITERIYEIRCKIVHTKAYENEGNTEVLLPFSKEVDDLVYDIEVIKYLSQQVIIFNGKNFSL